MKEWIHPVIYLSVCIEDGRHGNRSIFVRCLLLSDNVPVIIKWLCIAAKNSVISGWLFPNLNQTWPTVRSNGSPPGAFMASVDCIPHHGVPKYILKQTSR